MTSGYIVQKTSDLHESYRKIQINIVFLRNAITFIITLCCTLIKLSYFVFQLRFEPQCEVSEAPRTSSNEPLNLYLTFSTLSYYIDILTTNLTLTLIKKNISSTFIRPSSNLQVVSELLVSNDK